jgi:RNA recognition motif-containing protein
VFSFTWAVLDVYILPSGKQHSAESALALNGRELEPGLKMNVYISNPERKKERTDASADKKEIYVAGLSKFVKKEDLDKLFKTVRWVRSQILKHSANSHALQYGTITDIRMTVDQEGHSKGFAFIEFEQEVDFGPASIPHLTSDATLP